MRKAKTSNRDICDSRCTISLLCIINYAYLHTVSLWEATVGPEARQESVLQVDDGLTYFVICAQEVIVIHRDLQVLVLWYKAGELEHPGQEFRALSFVATELI